MSISIQIWKWISKTCAESFPDRLKWECEFILWKFPDHCEFNMNPFQTFSFECLHSCEAKSRHRTLNFEYINLGKKMSCLILLNFTIWINSRTLIFQYRFVSRWDLFQLSMGFIFTFIKACNHPFLILIYSEFLSLLVERTLQVGTSSPTIFLKWFGGGKVLWEKH